MGGAAFNSTERAAWRHLCHECPTRNSTSHMMAAAEESRSADNDTSSRRLSYRTNSVWFSSTIAMASRALAAQHIMLTLGGGVWYAVRTLVVLRHGHAVLQEADQSSDAAMPSASSRSTLQSWMLSLHRHSSTSL